MTDAGALRPAKRRARSLDGPASEATRGEPVPAPALPAADVEELRELLDACIDHLIRLQGEVRTLTATVSGLGGLPAQIEVISRQVDALTTAAPEPAPAVAPAKRARRSARSAPADADAAEVKPTKRAARSRPAETEPEL